jgi:hypothetical protein
MGPQQVRQYGVCALFSVNKAAHRAIEKGFDKSNLRRWCWTRYKGKGNQTLRVIVAYRPNPPQGPYTVYAQQNAYFHTISRDICPRKAFIADLEEELTSFLAAGDHIILMIDGNTNMKRGDLYESFTQLSLREAIIDKHGSNGPATHKRNSNSIPIDGIWITPGLQIERGGYCVYDDVIHSDHRCVWFDLSFITAFGCTMPPLSTRIPRRLHCKDPRLVANYIHLFHQYAKPLGLFHKVQALANHYHLMSKTEAIREYEELDLLRCKAMAFAERRCRKLRTGQVAYSPELNAIRLTIKAWLLLIARKQKRRVSSRLLSRSLKKTSLSYEVYKLGLEELKERLKEEYQHYYKIKGEAKQLRMTALEALALAMAEQGQTDKEKILKAL